MSDDGYTLVETLAALLVLGLAIAGLASGVQVLAGWQRRAADSSAGYQALRLAQVTTERLLNRSAPYRAHLAEDFSGDAGRLRFRCGPAECAVAIQETASGLALRIADGSGEPREVRLRQEGPARFVYHGRSGTADQWPPSDAVGRQELRSVSLVRTGDASAVPLIEARIWAEQPVECQFDPVLQDCR